MFDLGAEIQNWIQHLRSKPGFEDGDIEEIEIHIRDSIESSIYNGLSEQEAFVKATSSFGLPEAMSDEYIKSRTADMKLPKRGFLTHNHSKIAFRTISRNKGISLINLIGMSLGFASIFIIINWVFNEFSFDRFHKNKDRIYRVIEKQEFQGQDVMFLSAMPEWLSGEFEEDIPGIVASVGLLYWGQNWFGNKDNRFEAKHVNYTDNDIFKIFSLEFVFGDPETALQDPYSMVLTESLSTKLFKEEPPIGRTIAYQDKHPYTVTGVIEDIPGNSHFQADVLLSLKDRMPDWDRESYNHNTSIYILLEEKTDPVSLSGPLQEIKKLHLSRISEYIELQIQPLKDIHLHSRHTIWGQNWKKSDISAVIILLLVSILIIIISTINYINLSIALINKRFVEFGIKRIAGSSRASLIAQYFSESMIFLLIAFPISMLMVQILNPVLIASGILDNTDSLYHQFWFYLAAIGFIVILSFLTSIYPAFLLSSKKIMNLLHKSEVRASRRFPVSRLLIIAQLAISCTLIGYVGYMIKQINYMYKKDLGYEKEAIINFRSGDNFATHYETIKADLQTQTSIQELTSSNSTLGRSMWRNCIHFEGESEDDQWTTPYLMVDHNFIDFYNIRVVEGRSFDPDYALDRNNKAFIINESLANSIGREQIIGRKFKTCESEWGEIVGIVQDFNYNSLHHNIEPLAIQLGSEYKRIISVKAKPETINASLKLLEKTWNQYQPDQPFQYTFLDTKLKNLYSSEQRLLKIHTLFSFISIFLSCIGLLGVYISLVESKTKELGIRKAHGASSVKILIMLSRGVFSNIAFGLILAVPVTLISVYLWKKDYAFATDFSWWIFILSGIIVTLLAWLTVCYAVISASRRNPVEALRYE
jgi:putative ABC transport system permease protein